MTWVENLISYQESGKAKACPLCNSSEIKSEEQQFGERKTLFFECKHCGASTHFEGFTNK